MQVQQLLDLLLVLEYLLDAGLLPGGVARREQGDVAVSRGRAHELVALVAYHLVKPVERTILLVLRCRYCVKKAERQKFSRGFLGLEYYVARLRALHGSCDATSANARERTSERERAALSISSSAKIEREIERGRERNRERKIERDSVVLSHIVKRYLYSMYNKYPRKDLSVENKRRKEKKIKIVCY